VSSSSFDSFLALFLPFSLPSPPLSQPYNIPEGYTATELPKFLNTTPHHREFVRGYFYDFMANCIAKAVLDENKVRVQAQLTIPETNPEMDVYRVGTLLEMTREIVIDLCQDGKLVKVCVQGSMGKGVFQGLPISLAGVSKLMKNMDWGPATPFVKFGAVGEDEYEDDVSVYVLLAPQNIVGCSIMEDLEAMADKCNANDKAIVLLNPKLSDRLSAGGVMGIRGRSERINFAQTFESVGHFRLLYKQGTFFPIVGALRYQAGDRWEIYDRVDLPPTADGPNEQYILVGTFDREPGVTDITDCFTEVWKKAGTWGYSTS